MKNQSEPVNERGNRFTFKTGDLFPTLNCEL
uniref:Uncharacterized protein n=1 Tax=Nelumbo nucifera TaxID=4432 RepID=A0A822YMN7_NELNU|nr:TPA_asm: hypothetical protein HUJ06_011686 [Nelumbo nucifera]DAD32841.1 TPA_asm: hypothetical protein HUJ06_011692 [Nelumbo nucifera]DAD43628.1 TPA_asm: hypothetical protein HUJ06_001858 [Nelumbo nucifera]